MDLIDLINTPVNRINDKVYGSFYDVDDRVPDCSKHRFTATPDGFPALCKGTGQEGNQLVKHRLRCCQNGLDNRTKNLNNKIYVQSLG